jgi:hypothetical protein
MKRSLVALFVLAMSLSGFANAQCAAFPCVVASVSLTDQTTAASEVPIYTPPVNGLFRISAYEDTKEIRPMKKAYWKFVFGWTDGVKARTIVGSVYTNGWSALWAPIIVRAMAGQPIAYSVRPGPGNNGASSYDLYITVEQIQ